MVLAISMNGVADLPIPWAESLGVIPDSSLAAMSIVQQAPKRLR